MVKHIPGSFYVYHRSCYLWSPVIGVVCTCSSRTILIAVFSSSLLRRSANSMYLCQPIEIKEDEHENPSVRSSPWFRIDVLEHVYRSPVLFSKLKKHQLDIKDVVERNPRELCHGVILHSCEYNWPTYTILRGNQQCKKKLRNFERQNINSNENVSVPDQRSRVLTPHMPRQDLPKRKKTRLDAKTAQKCIA